MSQFPNSHHGHSSAVRFWKAKQPFNAFGLDWKEGTTHELVSPHDGFGVSVRFSTYPEHPEYIRVRSTNWRSEHEPNGVYHVEDARAFYLQLKAIGMVEREH